MDVLWLRFDENKLNFFIPYQVIKIKCWLSDRLCIFSLKLWIVLIKKNTRSVIIQHFNLSISMIFSFNSTNSFNFSVFSTIFPFTSYFFITFTFNVFNFYFREGCYTLMISNIFIYMKWNTLNEYSLTVIIFIFILKR